MCLESIFQSIDNFWGNKGTSWALLKNPQKCRWALPNIFYWLSLLLQNVSSHLDRILNTLTVYELFSVFYPSLLWYFKRKNVALQTLRGHYKHFKNMKRNYKIWYFGLNPVWNAHVQIVFKLKYYQYLNGINFFHRK